MSLNLCWWNLGISPPIKKKKEDKKEAIELAKKYIKEISRNRSIDLFALCEVSEEEEIVFTDLAEELDLTYLDLSGRVGRIIIDMSVMYESSKIEYISHKNITKSQPDGRNLRVGVRVVFKILKTEKILTIFLSHWPSMLSATNEIRDDIAIALRSNIDSIFERYGFDSQIICMGDYNTQPYSSSIHEKLFATRDFHQIKKRRGLLFNPFWGLLSNGKSNNVGTYYYKSPQANRWFVLDQMMFSSSFLYGDKPCIKLDKTSFDYHNIISDDNIISDHVFFKNFDHYPIFCRLSHDIK